MAQSLYDRYYHVGLNAPALDGFAVVTSDTTDFNDTFRSLYVGTAGNVVVVTMDGTVLTFKNVANGQTIQMMGKRVNATGTTASDIIGLI